MGVDPVGQRLRPGRLGKGEARRSQHRDEDLRHADFAGEVVNDDRNAVAGVIDEQPHVADVEQGMAEPAPIEQPVAELVKGQPGLERRDQEAALEKLTCIGRETAVVLVREVLCRNFRDRRSLAAFSGLTPSPYSSGGLQHEQGISKAGNAIVRARLVQLAWCWICFQTGSDITAWFVARTNGNSKRNKRVAIVAVARKLLVAHWRYATQGLVPTGAKMRPAAS